MSGASVDTILFMISVRKGAGWLRLLLLVFATVWVAHGDEAKPDPRGPGTIKMAKTLQEVAAAENPVNNIFLNTERAELIRKELAKPSAKQKRELRFSLATELLDSGQ